MSEKKGDIGKLDYLFNTSANLEVYIPTLGRWNRVTCLEFRSFNGKRRITQQTATKHNEIVDIPYETVDYDGPLYAFGTNEMVEKTNDNKLVESPILNERRKISQKMR